MSTRTSTSWTCSRRWIRGGATSSRARRTTSRTMSWLGRLITPAESREILGPPQDATELLSAARRHEREAHTTEAIGCLESAINEADRSHQPALLAEALRRLAVIRHKRDERV